MKGYEALAHRHVRLGSRVQHISIQSNSASSSTPEASVAPPPERRHLCDPVCPNLMLSLESGRGWVWWEPRERRPSTSCSIAPVAAVDALVSVDLPGMQTLQEQ
jgi:hypothetical protein